jgi:hypothetical protein
MSFAFVLLLLIMHCELWIIKRSSPLRQLHVIFHALSYEKQLLTCRVEHFKHKLGNIDCRGVFYM